MPRNSSRPPPPVAKRVPHERTHHGDTFVDDYEWLRDKESPETLAYLEAENAYTEARTAHLEPPARGDLRRDQGAHPGDRPLGARAGSATGGTTAAPTRASSTAPAAAARSPAPTTGPRRRSRPTSTIPGEQVAARRQRAGRGPRVLLPRRRSRSAPTAGCSPSAPTPSATSATCCGSRTCDTGELLPDEVPNTLGGGDLGPARARTLFYTTVDDAWRPDKVWRHVLGHPRRRRRGGAPRDRRAVLDGRGPHPQRPVPAASASAVQDHLGVRACSTRTTRPASSGSSHPAATASSTPSSTP